MSTKIIGTTSTIALVCFFTFGNQLALSMHKNDEPNRGNRIAKKSQLEVAVQAVSPLATTMKKNDLQHAKVKAKEEGKSTKYHHTTQKVNESEKDKSTAKNNKKEDLNQSKKKNDSSEEKSNSVKGATMNKSNSTSTEVGGGFFGLIPKVNVGTSSTKQKTDPSTSNASKIVKKAEDEQVTKKCNENSTKITDKEKRRNETTEETLRENTIIGSEASISLTAHSK